MCANPTALGDTTEPFRHRQDLRPECDTKAKREAEPPTVGVKDRCNKLKSTDCGDDAVSDEQHGECSQGYG